MEQEFDPKTYNELLVAPVDTHYVMPQNIWEKARSANITHEQIEDAVAKLAAYTQESFIKAASNDPKHRFTVVQTAGPKTPILEVALVQLVASKPALNAMAIGAGRWRIVSTQARANPNERARFSRITPVRLGRVIGCIRDCGDDFLVGLPKNPTRSPHTSNLQSLTATARIAKCPGDPSVAVAPAPSPNSQS